jgi:hypothetical protein
MISVTEFFQRMADYNTAIWPMQIITYALAIGVIALLFAKWKHSSRLIAGVLAFLWLWNGLVEIILFFGTVSSQYYFWGTLWIFQGLVFIYYGMLKSRFQFRSGRDISTYLGFLFILYAIVAYPIIGMLSGHGFPSGPIFGVAPCPVCIFTFGIFMMTRRRIPVYIFVFPLIWSLLGIYAAINFHVFADLGEVAAGVIGTLYIIVNNKNLKRREKSVQRS